MDDLEGNLPHRKRHIQLTYSNRAGLSDRKALFTWLLTLGDLLDAKTYSLLGKAGTSLYLSLRHSEDVAETWAQYFDVSIYRSHPFMQAKNRNCINVNSSAMLCAYAQNYLAQRRDPLAPPSVWNSWECLNLSTSPWQLKRDNCTTFAIDPMGVGNHIAATYASHFHRVPPKIPPSRWIVQLADAAVQRHNASRYGIVHVRRADRMPEVGQHDCTNPKVIAKRMRLRDHAVDGWIVYSYTDSLANGSGTGHRHAEQTEDPSYLPSLRREFNKLGKPILWESEFFPLKLAHYDNYVAYGVGVHLMHIADLRGACIDTRFCGAAGCGASI